MWKNIEGFDGYEVSDTGCVRNKNTRDILGSINGKGYHQVDLRKNKKPYNKSVHRLVAIAFLENPDKLPQVDHIDGNKSNNHVENLRWCTNKQNNQNKNVQSNNTSGVKGVNWHKKSQKWKCRIKIKDKQCHLGHYDCKEEAGVVYEFFALAFHKEYANITRKYNAWYSPKIYQKIKELIKHYDFKL